MPTREDIEAYDAIRLRVLHTVYDASKGSERAPPMSARLLGTCNLTMRISAGQWNTWKASICSLETRCMSSSTLARDSPRWRR